jgi:electron transfer flavoprotein beta subunit
MAYKAVSPQAGAPDNSVMALWDIPAIKADPEQCGLAGSPTKVKNITSVVLTAGEIRYIDPGEGGVAELIHELIADHTLG